MRGLVCPETTVPYMTRDSQCRVFIRQGRTSRLGMLVQLASIADQLTSSAARLFLAFVTTGSVLKATYACY